MKKSSYLININRFGMSCSTNPRNTERVQDTSQQILIARIFMKTVPCSMKMFCLHKQLTKRKSQLCLNNNCLISNLKMNMHDFHLKNANECFFIINYIFDNPYLSSKRLKYLEQKAEVKLCPNNFDLKF